MKYYLAPLEGITTQTFRKVYHTCFPAMDKYFTPFLSPHSKRGFNAKETAEISPENNKGMRLVPQILTNHASDFLKTAEKLAYYGYEEINLNLGCPSKTVVTKGRGSGFLAYPEELERFLDEIFAGTRLRISVKTRIGRDDPEEFQRLLNIYNQYPLEELIIHPRIQKDYYMNTPNLEVFQDAVHNSRNPLCYNGDICSAEDARRIEERFPDVEACMIGRGVIANPGLLGEITGAGAADDEAIRRFHDMLYEEYQKINMGDKNVLFKMKEIWRYLGNHFPGCEKLLKRMKKAEKLERYEEAAEEIFITSLHFKEHAI